MPEADVLRLFPRPIDNLPDAVPCAGYLDPIPVRSDNSGGRYVEIDNAIWHPRCWIKNNAQSA